MKSAAATAWVVGLTAVTLVAVPSLATARPHHHRHCRDRSTTLGRRVCRNFGDWSSITRLPPVTPELTVSLRSLGLPAGPAAPAAGARTTAPETTTPSQQYRAPGLGLRWSVGVRRGVYLGFGVEGGPVVERDPRPTGAATPVGFYAAGTLHAGVRQRVGALLLSAELGSGAMIVPIAPSVPAVEGAAMEPIDLGGRFVIEARARADIWLNPWFTAGAFAGADLQGRGAVAGLQFAMHLRAFDAGR